MQNISARYRSHLNCLYSILMQKANPEQIVRTLHFHDRNIYILSKGVFFIKHIKNDLIYRVVEAPAILGLTGLFEMTEGYHCTPESNSIAFRINRTRAYQVINQHRAFESVAIVMAYNTLEFNKFNDMVNTERNSYRIIKNIIEYIAEQNDYVTKRLKTISHIQNRSGLSRSCIAKTVSDLQAGGYIEIKKGTLVRIIKKLPIDY